MVDARWVLTRKEVVGASTVKARLVAKGYQDPDLRNGNVDIARCVSRRPSHCRLISLGALRNWPLSTLDIKNACQHADGLDREVCLRAPCDWYSKDDRRVLGLRASTHGLNDTPVAFRRPTHKYLMNSAESPFSASICFEVSSFGSRLCCIFVSRGGGA